MSSNNDPNHLSRREVLRNGASLAAAAALPLSLNVSADSSGLSAAEYRQYDGLGLASLVRKGEVSALELLELAIAQTEALNPTLNCVVEKLYDHARQHIAAGLPEGPFAGVPFVLKDLGMMLEGTVTNNGSRFYAGAKASYTSTLVQRYQQAGLVIFGKSASPEFGATPTTESILFGDTPNPWRLSYTPGGSSGGSAAAVAAGILPLANATDGGGSIRIPASCCGLFGMKPSRGRTPQGPMVLDSDFSVAHAVTRSVRDCAALLDATSGPEPGQTVIAPASQSSFLSASQTPPPKLRIGLITVPVTHSPVDPECRKATANTARLCESLGHSVEEISLPVDPQEFFEGYGAISAAGTVNRVQQRERELGRSVTENDLEPINWFMYQRGRNNLAVDLHRGRMTVARVARSIALLQQDYDVLLSPTMATPPVKLGKLSLNQPYPDYEREAISFSAFTSLYNATGQPAMSLPLHWTPDGLPVGVMFAGRYGEEALLYQLAGQLEQAQPWFNRLPPSIV
ncbi:amidase [Parahaliea sp. F7430]|uniref:Amidase n=1 Tax=Sediminihaliea albiluteola TaxID=2758564 RepID=A0A7W2TYC1_9GAMM|nr:amidase family protein [Sediminihaliea albiluteola]MBA6414167.1 amidase [Sediminihaliea albiluteola]